MLGGLPTSGQYRVLQPLVRRIRRGMHYSGFTIIEVLIVLAVSGLLLISAIILVSGKQNQAAFNQSIRQIQSQIQQRINEVATGYYENNGAIRCSGVGNVISLTAGGGTEQGANSGCVFLGKAMQFKVAGTNPEQFNTFSIAGLQKATTGSEVTTLALAKPKVIAPSPTEPGIPNGTDSQHLQNGLTAVRMWYNNGGGDRQIGAVAFVMSLAQYSSNGAIASGSQQVDVVPIDDGNLLSKLGQDAQQMAGVINSKLPTATLNPSNGVFICFASGSTNQSGLITIGNKNRQLSVTLTIKGNTTCS